MTYSELENRISADAADLLNAHLALGRIEQHQVLQILNRLSGAEILASELLLRIGVNQLLFLLQWMEKIHALDENMNGYALTLSRLLSSNGIETANEIISHCVLGLVFPDYRAMMPLYAEQPDGIIGIEPNTVPVEIKSRFPRIYVLINKFLKQVEEIFDVHPTAAVASRMHIINIKGLTEEICKSEIAYLQSKREKLLALIANRSEKTPFSVLINSQGQDSIDYTLTISFYDIPHNTTSVNMPTEWTEDCFSFSISSKVSNTEGLLGFKSQFVSTADAVKDELARKVVTRCLNNSKNKPIEPRVIAIFTKHATQHFPFLQKVMNSYVNAHPGTTIILLHAFFGEEVSMMQSGQIHASIGADLDHFIEQNSTPHFAIISPVPTSE